ncbi:hypothetical protein BH11ACT8_BH11ACT8_19350 [soil metagenome]
MLSVFVVEGYVSLFAAFALLALTIFAFVNALLYESAAYEAAGKLTKAAWCVIIGFAVFLRVVPTPLPLGNIIGIALLVATLVYLLDVRPALSGLRRR